MNQSEQLRMSSGRTPWRRLIQLRRKSKPKEIKPEPVLTLGSAANTAVPPPHLDSWQKVEAKRRLIMLCEWLDDRLNKPAYVNQIGKYERRITVFESLAYSVYSESRFVTSGTIIKGRYEASQSVFEVGRPLSSPWWLRPVLKNLNLVDVDQGDLFFDISLVDDIAQWLSHTAYRLLMQNPEFQHFRRDTLPRLFKFPKDIYSIALASRPQPVGPLIDSRTLNDVWRNEKAFRQVARENPHLLPLLLAFIEQIPSGRKVQTKDPVMVLKSKFREAGLPDAAWRYLVKHGARLFRIPWEITNGQPHFEVAVRYLEALNSAGLPPPPPPTLVKALLHGYNQHCQNDARLGAKFHHLIDPTALRAGLLEADRRRREGNVDDFSEEFMGVCWWSEGLARHLDDNQAKAGWQWFVRRWQEAEAEQALLEDTEPMIWTTRIDEFSMGRMTVVPIDTSAGLIRESLAMRNCLQTFMEDCASGELEVYSVRDTKTGKRKGCVGIRFENDGEPSIADVKGYANTPPNGEVQKAATELLWKLQCIDWD